jgi:hypothetical protein
LGNGNPDEEEDRREEQLARMDVNMVFTFPAEFHASAEDVAELTIGAGRAVFEKPENPGAHMKPVFIRGHAGGWRCKSQHLVIVTVQEVGPCQR